MIYLPKDKKNSFNIATYVEEEIAYINIAEVYGKRFLLFVGSALKLMKNLYNKAPACISNLFNIVLSALPLSTKLHSKTNKLFETK